MARNNYTKEQIQYLREISPGRYNDEITWAFNKKFGTTKTETAIRSVRNKQKIRSGIGTSNRKLYTDEHIAYLKELSDQGLFNREITEKFNKRFGLRRTEAAINNQRVKYGFKTTARHYWQKGHEPWNKGIKGWWAPGCEDTQFKKGDMPHNWVPVGAERVTIDGYTEIKIQENKRQRNWKGKHILVWEKHHGQKVPEGHAVIFGDGNKRNFDPENLILVSRAQLVRMNQLGLIKDDARLTRTGALIAEVVNKAGERRRENDGR